MYTIGADPEVFIRDTSTGGVVPITGLVGGTKEEPVSIGLEEGFAAQEDNVMLEFNIPPASDAVTFSNSIQAGLDAALALVRTRREDIELDFASYRAFSAAQLDNPQAQRFGCAPDFDGHKGGRPIKAVAPERLLRDDGSAWRFAGGHVHIGGYPEGTMPPYVIAQMCDVFLGLPCVALDQQGPRRKMYGTPGRFRPTAWGIEYRTLSNFWIFDDGLCTTIGDRAISLAEMIAEREQMHAVYQEIPWRDVQAAIIREDEALAADLIAYIRTDLDLEV